MNYRCTRISGVDIQSLEPLCYRILTVENEVICMKPFEKSFHRGTYILYQLGRFSRVYEIHIISIHEYANLTQYKYC